MTAVSQARCTSLYVSMWGGEGGGGLSDVYEYEAKEGCSCRAGIGAGGRGVMEEIVAYPSAPKVVHRDGELGRSYACNWYAQAGFSYLDAAHTNKLIFELKAQSRFRAAD